MLTCTKLFTDIPFAHRQHTHAGHCRFIHGHNWTFELCFVATHVDACGFILDFGGQEMKDIKAWINSTFDHKLVLNQEDPFRADLVEMLERHKHGDHEYKLADITTVPDASCEGLAKLIFRKVSELVYTPTHGRVSVSYARVLEDFKNSATFQP